MALYVSDTHALLWYLGGSPQLSMTARAAFDEAVSGSNQVIVPAIVLAELVMLAEKRRRAIDVNRIVATLQSILAFASPLCRRKWQSASSLWQFCPTFMTGSLWPKPSNRARP